MLSLRLPRPVESNYTLIYSHVGTFHQQQGKMKLIYTICFLLFCVHEALAIDMMPELKRNILNFGYGVNFKYEGMLSHSFDRFYVVTKFEIPKIKDLRLTTFSFDLTCKHLNISNHYMQTLFYIKHCKRIAPYVKFYKKQIEYYNCTAYEILQNEIGLILPTFINDNRQKRGVIAKVLGSIASSVVGLAYEGISSFLHHKRHKAFHKAVKVIEKRTDMQCNRVYHLEDTMIMYGTYNSDMLMDLTETVHKMHNVTTLREKIFVGTMPRWLKEQLMNSNNEYNYATDSMLFLTTIKEKYVRVYEKFIFQGNKNTLKRVFSYYINAAIKIRNNFRASKNSTWKNK